MSNSKELGKIKDYKHNSKPELKFKITHEWIEDNTERIIGNLDEKFYRPLLISKQREYFIKKTDDKIFVYNNDNNLIGIGTLSYSTNYFLHNTKEKKMIADYSMNFFAGGRFTIYDDGTAYLTKYGSGGPIINSSKGIIQSIISS